MDAFGIDSERLTRIASMNAELASQIPQADFLCGSDEVGYGAWSGPLLVCAVRIPRDWPEVSLVADSKTLSPQRREAIYSKILSRVTHTTVEVPVEEIDQKGVYACLLEAHLRATSQLVHGCEPGKKIVTIVDGTLAIPGTFSLPKADALIPAVSAASILAKVTRDRQMDELDKQYPGYGFAKGKGYGTAQHQKALETLGVCPVHRKSYGPIAEILNTRGRAPTTVLDDFSLLPEE